MVKKILFLVFIIFCFAEVGAISSTFKEIYQPKETMIGSLEGIILGPIEKSQVKILRDGHVPVSVKYDLKQLGGKYYIWLIAPSTTRNYTLIVEDVVTLINGQMVVIDYEKDFSIQGGNIDYSIEPGFIFSSSDFEIKATLYDDLAKTISVDFPEEREITLYPGENIIELSIAVVEGTQMTTISAGRYAVPSYIIGHDPEPGAECGNGIIEEGEECDDLELGGNDCTSVGTFTSGNLSCDLNCNFDVFECIYEPELSDADGDGVFDNEDNCPLNANPKQDDEDDDGVGNICEEKIIENFSVGENKYFPEFKFFPEAIVSKVLVSKKFLEYKFNITNVGKGNISEVYFEYDTEKIVIYPDRGTLGPNESLEFDMIIKNNDGQSIRDIVFAFAENVSEYLLISVSFTDKDEEVYTEYIKEGKNQTQVYYCSELKGVLCLADEEECSGEEVQSLEGYCCVSGLCEKISKGSKAWIGYLIAAIIILVLLIVYLKYRKTKRGGSPLAKRVEGIEKSLP